MFRFVYPRLHGDVPLHPIVTFLPKGKKQHTHKKEASKASKAGKIVDQGLPTASICLIAHVLASLWLVQKKTFFGGLVLLINWSHRTLEGYLSVA